MATSMPIRIDEELYDSAKVVGAQMSRSATQQVAHWARIGRELESSRSISTRDVAAVLAGEVTYDDVGAREQAVVRAAWNEGISASVASLDVQAELADAGVPYATLDEDGNAVILTPEGAPTEAPSR
jgi:hypothetical protein